jgi:hypothetical protein
MNILLTDPVFVYGESLLFRVCRGVLFWQACRGFVQVFERQYFSSNLDSTFSSVWRGYFGVTNKPVTVAQAHNFIKKRCI